MSLQQLFTSSALRPETQAVAADTRIYEPDDPATHIYYIRSGEVRTYQVGQEHHDRLLEILGPGDWFNAAAFSHNQPCGHRAVATAKSVFLRVSADRLLHELTHHCDAATLLLKQLSDRLLTAREDAAHLVFDDCNQRLIHTLVQLSQTVAATPRDDGGVELRITHLELAQAVGAARETVSLALTDLRKQNLLRTGRNKVYFDPQVLRDLQVVCKSPVPGDSDSN